MKFTSICSSNERAKNLLSKKEKKMGGRGVGVGTGSNFTLKFFIIFEIVKKILRYHNITFLYFFSSKMKVFYRSTISAQEIKKMTKIECQISRKAVET